MKLAHRWLIGLAALGAAALMVGGVLASLRPALAQRAPGTRAALSDAHASMVFRFDAAAQTFVTIPLPAGSTPIDVAVTGTNPTHVWVTEFGRDQIGHIVYTGTNDYQLIEYPVTSTSSSGPYRLTIDGDYVWFTERHANRIGRLHIVTGQIDEFDGHGLSSNSGLSDIEVGPNGWLWIGGQWSQRLVRLIVTSTVVYAFTEYTDTLRPNFVIAPDALAIDQANNLIFFTVPDAPYYKAAQYEPFTQFFTWPIDFPANSRLMDVVVTPGEAWFSDVTNNLLDQIEIGTYTIVNTKGPIARPFGLAAQSATTFWVTQQTEHGAVGRLIYTPTVTVDSYPLPTAGLRPTGIAVAADHGVWFAAYRPLIVYLPTVMKK